MLSEYSIVRECNTELTDMLFFLNVGSIVLLRYVSDCISLEVLTSRVSEGSNALLD